MFKSPIPLDAATKIVDVALAKGRDMGLKPLTVAVLDAGGHLVVLKRADGTSPLRPQIAMGKAFGCLSLGFGGREMARRAEKMPGFMNALSDLVEGRAVPVPGGVLVRDTDGFILGAVGVTGDTSANDEICAVEGIRSAGFQPDTGDPD